jgi:outer membrane protein assembly factor BamB
MGNQGYWAYAIVNDNASLISLDTQSRVRFVRGSDHLDILRPTPDGGAVTAASLASESGCTVRKYLSSGSLQWTVPTRGTHCLDMQVDGAGGVWVRSGHSFAEQRIGLGTDGVQRATFANSGAGPYFGRRFAALPNAGGVYLAGSSATESPNLERGIVARLDSRGRPAWQWSAPPQSISFTFDQVAADPSGNVYVLGRPTDTPYRVMIAASLTMSGSVRWMTQVDSADLIATRDIVPASDGAVFAVTEEEAASGSQQILRRFDAQGRMTWRYVVGPAQQCTLTLPGACPRRVFAANGGEAWVSSVDGSSQFTLTRLTTAGTVRANVSIDHARLVGAVVVPGDRLLTVLTTFDQQFPRYRTSLFDANGNEVPAFDSLSAPASAGTLFASAIERDGTTYLLTQSRNRDHYWISRVDPSGMRRWQVMREGAWSTAAGLPRMTIGSDRVCAGGVASSANRVVLTCLSTATGADLWTRTVLDAGSGSTPIVHHRALTDGRVLAVASDGLGTRHLLFGTNGEELGSAIVAPGHPRNVAFASDGTALIGAANPVSPEPDRIVRVAANGRVHYAVNAPTPNQAQYSMLLTDSGSALLVDARPRSNQSFDVVATRLDDNGVAAWSKSIATTPANVQATFRHTDNSVYVSLDFCCVVFGETPMTPIPSTLLKLDLASGDVAWRHTVDNWTFRFTRLELDASQSKLLTASAWPGRIRKRVIDTRSGEILGDDNLACDTDDCWISMMAIDDHGSLRVASDTQSSFSGDGPRIYRLDAPMAVRTRVEARQPGVAGAWYAPYSSGQGFVIEFDPGTGTLFAPWFTFTPDGDNNPASLRWFSLQGITAPAETGVDLLIVQNTGGQFVTPPITQPMRVGSASLAFHDCDSATLRYRFDSPVNSGREGLISLTRLTPRGVACRLSDGNFDSVTPRSERDGFNQHHSGAWFDPQTSGQGLMFSVTPRTATDDGVLYAAWFTYDLADNVDDPTQQYWLTIQGSLAKAANGRITLPIYRTIGGLFDLRGATNTQRIGQADIHFQDCATASMQYRFDASDVALPFSSRSGTFQLQRIGGCATSPPGRLE